MAKKTIQRWIAILFDRPSAKKAEEEMKAALGSAGKKGGENFVRELKAAFDKRMADLKTQLAKGIIDPKQFKVQADLAAKQFNAGIIAGMEKARAAGTLTDSAYLKLSRTLKRVGDDGTLAGGRIGAAFKGAIAAAAGFLTFGKAKQFLADSIHEAIAAEDAIGRLDVALRTVGRNYRGVRDEAERYITQLTKTTRFTDGDARLALAHLIVVTGSYEKALKLLNVTAQIAEKRNITMADAAQTAGDAANGLTKGMKDLGISTKETGDIVAKIEGNLGRLAEEGLTKPGRQLQQINKLWDQFKEKIGLAILASNGLQGSLGDQGLVGVLTSLNDWAEKNSTAIGSLVDKMLGLVKVGQAVGKFWATYIPNLLMISKLIDKIRGKKDFSDVESFSSTTAPPKPGGGGGGTGTPNEKLAAELEKINRDIRVKQIALDEKLTEDQARVWQQREEVVKGSVQRIVTSVQAGWAKLAELDARLAVGLNESVTPAMETTAKPVEGMKFAVGSAIPPIQEMTREMFIAKSVAEAAAQGYGALADATADAAARQWDAANEFVTPWSLAMDRLRFEVEGQGSLFRELGEAWAEGGIVGLARLAAAKVKENIAQAIEWAAKALGFVVLGNPKGAAGAAGASAKHFAAAAAWKVAGAASGGGGEGGGIGGGSGFSAGGANARGADLRQPMQDIHVHFVGPGFKATNPVVQKVVQGANEIIQERYGNNVRIITHRDD